MIIQLGYIHKYDVIIIDDVITVMNHNDEITKQQVSDIGSFVAKAKELRLGWASFPDFEVIYIYDKADNYFGYAVNLQDEVLSEWGYAPFQR
jgi:hypothetical protein